MTAPGFAQTLNFQPLERGDYTEEEQKVFLLRGMEASGGFGLGVAQHHFQGLTGPLARDQIRQDFRLNLRTVVHRELEMHLNLETAPAPVDGNGLRVTDQEDAHQLGTSQALSLIPREAFLKFKFNPNSALTAGKHEISLGDRRGKVFDGILPALTYDCKAGTWCFPVGAARTGEVANDWIFHWALQYTAWKTKSEGLRDTLEVEIFRVFYNEANVPLGTNRGPASYDVPGNPAAGGENQAVDSQNTPIFFKADSMEYFGFRVNWEGGRFFVNFDTTLNQGRRILHSYWIPGDTGTPTDLDLDGTVDAKFRQSVSGVAIETEFGYRSPGLRYGVRLLSATGDPQLEGADKIGLAGDQRGYYEIVPGAYRGTRLYFNGSTGDIGTGGGLGHSINNTRMYGFFLDFTSPLDRGFDYHFGIYKLLLVNPILDGEGFSQDEIGVELDNRFSFYLRKSLTLDLEINFLRSQGAFRLDSFSAPLKDSENFTQGLVGLNYRF